MKKLILSLLVVAFSSSGFAVDGLSQDEMLSKLKAAGLKEVSCNMTVLHPIKNTSHVVSVSINATSLGEAYIQAMRNFKITYGEMMVDENGNSMGKRSDGKKSTFAQLNTQTYFVQSLDCLESKK